MPLLAVGEGGTNREDHCLLPTGLQSIQQAVLGIDLALLEVLQAVARIQGRPPCIDMGIGARNNPAAFLNISSAGTVGAAGSCYQPIQRFAFSLSPLKVEDFAALSERHRWVA